MNEIALPLVDLVIAFTVIEVLALLLYRRVTGQGVAPRDFLVNMVSGICLMLALRAALHDAGLAWLVLFLLAAGAAHGVDILMRWRRQAPPGCVDRRVIA